MFNITLNRAHTKKYGLLEGAILTYLDTKPEASLDDVCNELSYVNRRLVKSAVKKLNEKEVLSAFVNISEEQKVIVTEAETVTYTNADDETITVTKYQLLNDMIDAFVKVNPGYTEMFKRKIYKTALDKMLTSYGVETVWKLINILHVTNKMKYAPIVTTTLELEKNAPRLIAFIQRQQNNESSNVIL